MATVAFVVSLALLVPPDSAQGRVDGPSAWAMGVKSPDTVVIVTGGGTVVLANSNASFGFNSQRPTNFLTGTGGPTIGRLNFDEQGGLGRHVNVPIKFKSAEVNATLTPNGTGGKATIVGDCTDATAQCPASDPPFRSVLVYLEDNADSGAGSDMFQISFCLGAAESTTPTGCGVAEGGFLDTGNTQVRPGGQ
jgi:hypothetical protein